MGIYLDLGAVAKSESQLLKYNLFFKQSKCTVVCLTYVKKNVKIFMKNLFQINLSICLKKKNYSEYLDHHLKDIETFLDFETKLFFERVF